MKYLILLFLIEITFATSLKSQATIEPSSLTLGIETVGQVVEDTILYWSKSHGAMRGGFFRTGNITSNNTGQFSLAFGSENIAKGNSSIALGAENEAMKFAAIALGSSNESLGLNSVTLGTDLIVKTANTVAVGISNIDIPEKPDHRLLEPIFVVGNGYKTNGGRSNALTVILDGRTGLNTETPECDLHLVHKNVSNRSGLRIENKENGNYWRFYTRSLSHELALYNNSFMGDTIAVGEFNTSGNYMGPSDIRLKKDIEDLPYGLNEVLQLAPKRYQFKHVEGRKDIGLIAQEVIDIVPELVSYHVEDDSYKMNYDGYGVLAIKAIQELKDIVDVQQREITELKNMMTSLLSAKQKKGQVVLTPQE